jgi:serine/threonine protein kinase
MTETWERWVGQVVDGKFFLRTFLGGSENGGVFLTEYPAPEGQRSAIKLVPADPQNIDPQLSRWSRAATLAHPHLIRIFQTGRCQLGGQKMLYVVTEFAEEDLAQIVPQRPLTSSEGLDMLRPLLDALTYLHGKGLVHGHLTPANIMVVDDQLKISSDRIRAAGENRPERIKPDTYDAPETPTRGYSAAGDVWSLGVTLVEALTQQLPVWEFQGQETPLLPPTLPAPFPDVVQRCLRRDPQGRSKISEIAARLLPDAAIPQTRTTPKPDIARLKSRQKSQVWSAVILVVLVLILVGAKVIRQRQAEPNLAVATPPHRSQQPSPQTIPAEQPAEKSLPDRALLGDAVTPVAPAPSADGGSIQPPISSAPALKGQVARPVLPDVPQKALNTIQGTLKSSIRVQVDSSGDVTSATPDVPGPSQYFAKFASDAAREWKFNPPKSDGQNVASEWILRFEFSQKGARAKAGQTAP